MFWGPGRVTKIFFDVKIIVDDVNEEKRSFLRGDIYKRWNGLKIPYRDYRGQNNCGYRFYRGIFKIYIKGQTSTAHAEIKMPNLI